MKTDQKQHEELLIFERSIDSKYETKIKSDIESSIENQNQNQDHSMKSLKSK